MACCGYCPVPTEAAPLVMGEPNDAPARLVRLCTNFQSWTPGQSIWVTGSSVDWFVAGGFGTIVS